MPHNQDCAVRGTITHVFGHRFVVQTDQKSLLADLTPKGVAEIDLRVGDQVELVGEPKPSELKVSKFTTRGKTICIAHGPKHDHHANADPAAALRSVADAGYTTIGQPRRKPKHFEVLAQKGSQYFELHIELDGHIRKSKLADRTDPKWPSLA